jgi:hypothetical protein
MPSSLQEDGLGCSVSVLGLQEKCQTASSGEMLDGAENARGKKEDGCDELKCAVNDDAEQTEGQQDEPDEGIENKREERGRPAYDEQDAEEEKFDHR